MKFDDMIVQILKTAKMDSPYSLLSLIDASLNAKSILKTTFWKHLQTKE